MSRSSRASLTTRGVSGHSSGHSTEPPTAVVDGRLEAVRDGRVRGWAWTADDPAGRLRVRVIVDGEPVAGTVAGLHWPRLEAAGIGDGAHGFDVALPPSLGDGGMHAVQVLAGPDDTPLRTDLAFSAGVAAGSPFAGTDFIPVDLAQNPSKRDVTQAGQSGTPADLPASAPRLAASEALQRPSAQTRGALLRFVQGARGVTWSSYAPRTATAPQWLLAAGCIAYFLLAVYLTRRFSFFQDDYAILDMRRAWNANAFLVPDNQHLLLTFLLFYKLLFVTVGLGTFWPYQLPVFGAHIALVVALYVLAARRSGRWMALVPAGLMLVVFPGYEDMLWSINVSLAGAVAAGLWALVCLERRDRRGDIWACVLIGLSVSTFSTGLFITFAIGVGLAITNWRRLWVVGVPLLLYALWYSHYGQSDIVWSNVSSVPSYDLHIAGYGFAGLLGMSSSVFGSRALIVGYPLLAAAVAWLVYQGVHRRLTWLTIVGVLAAVGFWTGTALARASYGEPDASRYLYSSAAFILLAGSGAVLSRKLGVGAAIAIGLWALVTLAHAVLGQPDASSYPYFSAALIVLALAGAVGPGKATRRAAIALAVAVAGVAIVSVGLTPLRGYATERTTIDALVRVQLGATQMAGPAGDPGYVIDSRFMGGITVGDWLAVVHELGSNAFTPSKIEQMPAWYQHDADATLIGAEGITLRRAVGPPAGAACARLRGSGSPALLRLRIAPGSIAYVTAARGSAVKVWLRRLSHDFPSQVQEVLPAGARARIVFPHDASSLPWGLQLGTALASPATSGPHAMVCLAGGDAATAL